MLKLAEIKEMTSDEISEQLKKSNIELANLRMKFVSRQLDDASLIKKNRKEIARLLTVQTQKLNEIQGHKKVSRKLSKIQKNEDEGKLVKEVKTSKIKAEKKDPAKEKKNITSRKKDK